MLTSLFLKHERECHKQLINGQKLLYATCDNVLHYHYIKMLLLSSLDMIVKRLLFGVIFAHCCIANSARKSLVITLQVPR